MAKSLDDIFDSDDFGLLDAKPVRSYVQTDEDRLIESFEEINVFYEKNSREPSTTSMSEYSLQARLKAIRDNEKTKGMLKSFDRHSLLGEVEAKPQSIDDILQSDELGLLGAEGDNSIFNFIHTPKPGSRADAEYIAQRKSMSEREFKKYETMFQQVHRELKEGKRKLLPFNDAERNLLEGNFYLVDGLLAYLEVSNAEKVLKENESGDRIRLEGRTLTIFENGTVSNMLFRSLGKAIQKNGKMITNTEENIYQELQENSGLIAEEDIHDGWIYILKSKSENPLIKNIQNLYKIGFTKQPVTDRIRNAPNEATYLYAEVELVANYATYNLNANVLESLLHRFFGKACLDIDLYNAQNKRYNPREWFIAPLPIIDEAVEMLVNGTIVNYRYDMEREEIVLKSKIKNKYTIPYQHAKEVFEFAYENITIDPYGIAADFEKIVKKHFKEMNPEMLARIMTMPMEYWKKLIALFANRKPPARVDAIKTSEKKEPEPLHLILQRVYFDQILAGTKTSEYREQKKIYDSRLMRDGKYRNYSHVDFQEGYRKDARQMKVEIKKIELSNGIYEIFLGKIVEKNF